MWDDSSEPSNSAASNIATWIESLGFMPRDTSVLSGKMIIAAKIDAAIASSRSAFATELVRRLDKEMGIFNEREHSENAHFFIQGLMKAIAIIRQMAGEK